MKCQKCHKTILDNAGVYYFFVINYYHLLPFVVIDKNVNIHIFVIFDKFLKIMLTNLKNIFGTRP